jgi:hypothetical protein
LSLEPHEMLPLTRPSLRSGHPLPATRGEGRMRGTLRANYNKMPSFQDEGGANIRTCASAAASSRLMNTAPAAIKSFNSSSSASIR